MEARVGIELSNTLQGNNLLILVSDKTRKNAGNGELRYTAGTWQACLRQCLTVR
jgi:hypothetical protein